eukprot:scaffold944_cov333-Pavlova_lutheri.AAC.27
MPSRKRKGRKHGRKKNDQPRGGGTDVLFAAWPSDPVVVLARGTMKVYHGGTRARKDRACDSVRNGASRPRKTHPPFRTKRIARLCAQGTPVCIEG